MRRIIGQVEPDQIDRKVGSGVDCMVKGRVRGDPAYISMRWPEGMRREWAEGRSTAEIGTIVSWGYV
jgi:hypothetical protein